MLTEGHRAEAGLAESESEDPAGTRELGKGIVVVGVGVVLPGCCRKSSPWAETLQTHLRTWKDGSWFRRPCLRVKKLLDKEIENGNLTTHSRLLLFLFQLSCWHSHSDERSDPVEWSCLFSLPSESLV